MGRLPAAGAKTMAQEGFFKLIRDAQLEPVRIQIVANKAVLEYTTPDGFRPLEYAVVLVADKRGSSIDMVNLLLNQGAAPSDRVDPSGPTALHHAVRARVASRAGREPPSPQLLRARERQRR